VVTYLQLKEHYRLSDAALKQLVDAWQEADGPMGKFGLRDAEAFTVDEFFSAMSQEICPLCGQFAAGQMVELPWFQDRGYVRACETCCAEGASDIRMLLDDGGKLPDTMQASVEEARQGKPHCGQPVLRRLRGWMTHRLGNHADVDIENVEHEEATQ